MIALCYGTRPEYIKILPLITILKKNNYPHIVIFTGQHEDIANFNYDAKIEIKNGENRLNSIVTSIIDGLTEIIKNFNISHVMVQGDTSSALGIAISAFNNNVQVIHLEAGLRTYDNENPYPEEMNRKLISQIAAIHFCPTIKNAENLRNEHIFKSVHIVGNTVIDSLMPYKNDNKYENIILITLHRRENHYWLDKWFFEINEIAKKYNDYEFILPIHPNPNVKKHRAILTNVKVIDSLSHEEFLKVLNKSKLVITDSGGIQEECSFFNKKCLVCRKVTERPEALGYSSFLVKKPSDLKKLFEYHINNYNIDYICPYGDGNSSIKIYNVLMNMT